jgi:probable rRNA maturation factor
MTKHISVSLVGDKEIKRLNKEHRGKDDVTDVLSFNVNGTDEEGNEYIGDVVVNEDQAKRQASDYENTIEQEVAALVEHGVLHLLGVHHDGDD